MCVPIDLSLTTTIIHEFHDTNGHANYVRTLANLSQVFYISRVSNIVRRFCKHCTTFERINVRALPKYGFNLSLSVPNHPWVYISMNFITIVPEVNGYDAIYTSVDLFTKQAQFMPYTMKIYVEQHAKL